MNDIEMNYPKQFENIPQNIEINMKCFDRSSLDVNETFATFIKDILFSSQISSEEKLAFIKNIKHFRREEDGCEAEIQGTMVKVSVNKDVAISPNPCSGTMSSKEMELLGLDSTTKVEKCFSERISNWLPTAKDAFIGLVTFGIIRTGYQTLDKYFFKPLVTFKKDEMEINFGAALQKTIELASVTLAVVTFQNITLSSLAGMPLAFRASILTYLTYGAVTASSLLIPEIFNIVKNRSEYINSYSSC